MRRWTGSPNGGNGAAGGGDRALPPFAHRRPRPFPAGSPRWPAPWPPSWTRPGRAKPRGPQALAGVHARLAELDPVAAARMEPTNRRRVVRALEVTRGVGPTVLHVRPRARAYPPTPFALVGLPVRPRHRPADRGAVHRPMEDGFLDEVRALAARPGGCRGRPARRSATGSCWPTSRGACPCDAALSEAIRRTRAFARRQWAWFRRDPRIVWVGEHDDRWRRVTGALGGGDSAANGKLRATDRASDDHTDDDALHQAPRAGNDFLVLVDLDAASPLEPAVVRAPCATVTRGGCRRGDPGRWAVGRCRPHHGAPQRRRGRGRDERQRHPLPGPGGRATPVW